MKAKWLYNIILMIFLSCSGQLNAQLEKFENFEEIGKKDFWKTHFKDLFKGFTDFGDPFTFTGGIGLNLRSYSAYGEENLQDPFFYGLNANINFRIYKLNLPFSLMITAKNRESSLPNLKEILAAFKQEVKDGIQAEKDKFLRFGASPNYKWIKIHLGHRSMNFSKFTLADLNFYGAGIELTPGKWQFSAMYGRLAKAEPIDLSLFEPNVPVYERLGWGTMLGYGTDDQSIQLVLFKAIDNISSIFIPDTSEEQKSPEENFVVGLNVQKLFFDKFRFKGDFAISGFSPNSLDANLDKSMYPDFLFKEKLTTENNTAFDVTLNYEAAKFTTGLQLKRIDPNYKSLGAYFFNNDVVDLLANLNFGLFDGAITTTTSGGIQANNLRFINPTTTSRLVITTDISYSKDAFSTGINFSNNRTDVAYVLNQGLDSLNAVIVTNDAGVNMSYSVTDKSTNQHTFTITGNLQTVGDDIVNPLESAKSEMIVGNFVYNYNLTKSGWAFTLKSNYNQNELSQMLTKRYGGGLGIAKSFLKDKMNMGIDVDYFLNTNETEDNNSNMNGQLQFDYNVFEGFTTNLSVGYLKTETIGISSFAELTATLGLQYSFNYTLEKGKVKGLFKRKKKGENQKEASDLDQKESESPESESPESENPETE